MHQLGHISQNLMIILGMIMYIFGTIGNIFNILIFLRWSRLQKKSQGKCNSSLYLFVSSISNLIIIIYPLLTRIIFDGFEYSVTKETVFILCKFRYYILHTFDLISLTCICLATLDRYLISSRKVRLRQKIIIRKRAEQLILFIIILIAFYCIPIAIFFDVSNNGRCAIYSPKFLYYYFWIFQICLHSIIPIIFLTILGTLTYKQLRKMKRTKRIRTLNSNKQLSRMLLLMCIAIVLSSIPYCIEHIYFVMTPNDPLERTSYIFLYHVITSILFYTNPVTSFYVFFISTPNFRRHIRQLIFGKSHTHRFDCETFSMINPSSTLHE
ncbi:unnamed protein product [Adineta steineri]|uniref:G-protein coupled receptors family 1 profile domain-containing protein n=1 Tax=Adineta steineri TaxID=433720 RepID=A0A814ZP44_9BILA|nr:unnamed protein product [Adineta steineri]